MACYNLMVWLYHWVTMWLCRCVTESMCDCMTVSLCDFVTASLLDCVTLWLCGCMTVCHLSLFEGVTVWQKGCVTDLWHNNLLNIFMVTRAAATPQVTLYRVYKTCSYNRVSTYGSFLKGDSMWKHREKHDNVFLDFWPKKSKVFDIFVIKSFF